MVHNALRSADIREAVVLPLVHCRMGGQDGVRALVGSVFREGRLMQDGLIIDMFAGGGGASVGIEMALGRSPDIAVNHDPMAILMHKTNHPHTLHLTEDIFEVDFLRYTKGRHVSLVWASPDCTSHSKAKGGQPRNSGLRILPWAVYKHAKVLNPDVIVMENVEEIQQWGKLDENGKIIPAEKGKEYRRFINAMKSLGYAFDSWELVAADYGAPTTRKRWYAVFRNDGQPIACPTPTHSKDGGLLKKWVPCGDYIDWSDLGKSIFDRKKPLAEKTMNRIGNGFMKFVVNNPNPYIVKDGRAMAYMIQYHSETKKGDARGQELDKPIQTIDTSNRYGLVTAFMTKFYKTGMGHTLYEPCHTITTSPGHFGVVSAWLIKYYSSGENAVTLDEPLPTITTKDRFGLASAMIEIQGEKYILEDILLRMLKPEELKLMQGFPKDYIIAYDYKWNPYPKTQQVARIGNSVVPIMAKAIIEANCSEIKLGDRKPKLYIMPNDGGQMAFA